MADTVSMDIANCKSYDELYHYMEGIDLDELKQFVLEGMANFGDVAQVWPCTPQQMVFRGDTLQCILSFITDQHNKLIFVAKDWLHAFANQRLASCRKARQEVRVQPNERLFVLKQKVDGEEKDTFTDLHKCTKAFPRDKDAVLIIYPGLYKLRQKHHCKLRSNVRIIGLLPVCK